MNGKKESFVPYKIKYEKNIYPKIKKSSSNLNCLILPFLNSKTDEIKPKSNLDKNGNNQDHKRKNIFSWDNTNKNIMSPRKTEFNFKKKNIGKIELEKKIKYKLKLKEVNSNGLFINKSKDEEISIKQKKFFEKCK